MQAKSQRKLLLFHISKEKIAQIQKVCNKFNISIQKVEPRQYGENLGALAGISGMKATGKAYIGAELPSEMMIFSGIDSDTLDDFMAEYKKTGISSIPLKAVLTPFNVSMSVGEIYQELVKEHNSLCK